MSRERPDQGGTDVPAPVSATPEQLAELLDGVRTMRLSLSSDLAAAAGAVDESELRVAREILTGQQQDLATHLARTRDGVEATGLPSHELAVVPLIPPRPRAQAGRRRRTLLALPAVPVIGALALSAAAALTSHGSPSHPTSATQQPYAATVGVDRLGHDVPATTLQQLTHAIRHHASRDDVIAVANRFHAQLVALLKGPDTVARLQEVRHLLAVEQHMLRQVTTPTARLVLAASRELAATLHGLVATLPHRASSAAPQSSGQPHAESPAPTPTARPTRHRTHSAAPSSATASPSSSPSSLLPSIGPNGWLIGR